MSAQKKQLVAINFEILQTVIDALNTVEGIPVTLALKKINEQVQPSLIVTYKDNQACLAHCLTMLPLIHSIKNNLTFEFSLLNTDISLSISSLNLLTTEDIQRLEATKSAYIEKNNQKINDALIRNLLQFIKNLNVLPPDSIQQFAMIALRAQQPKINEQAVDACIPALLAQLTGEHKEHINYPTMLGYETYVEFLFAHKKTRAEDNEQQIYLNNTFMCVQELMLAQEISTHYQTYTENPRAFLETRSHLLNGLDKNNTFAQTVGWRTSVDQPIQPITKAAVDQHIEKRLSHIKSLASAPYSLRYKVLGACLIGLGAILAVSGVLLTIAGAGLILPSFGTSFSAMIGGTLLSIAGIATIGVGVKLIKSSVRDENLSHFKPKLITMHGLFSNRNKADKNSTENNLPSKPSATS